MGSTVPEFYCNFSSQVSPTIKTLWTMDKYNNNTASKDLFINTSLTLHWHYLKSRTKYVTIKGFKTTSRGFATLHKYNCSHLISAIQGNPAKGTGFPLFSIPTHFYEGAPSFQLLSKLITPLPTYSETHAVRLETLYATDLLKLFDCLPKT